MQPSFAVVAGKRRNATTTERPLSTAATDTAAHPVQHRPWKAASLFCMGVVFGDIGTSPLYTLNVAAKAASPTGTVTPEAVLGVVSLIFWSLIVVISIKYAILIMRADNHGEGGILALLALVSPKRARESRLRAAMVVVGLIGATLLYGDGAITPAISVLSAIEGIKVYAPHTGHIVVPLTVVILMALFIIQRKGTSFIGGLFGPIMLLWFVVIALLGLTGIASTPAILAALSPLPAINYLFHAGPMVFAVIGSAFLAVTGGEAFYADMGHFGPLPIRVAWFGVALPALTLNYFGQGALLLTHPAALASPFYELAPAWAHIPLVALATGATVIAAQAVISGAFSLTHQAMQLGFLPRMTVVHTAGRQIGQIYMPFVNWALALLTLAAVIGFGSSDALAGAYGVAVSLLMAITTLMATFVALQWNYSVWLVALVNGSLLLIDLLFVASTSTKLVQGGWFPLLTAGVISFLMLTWRKGEHIMEGVRRQHRQSLQEFAESIERDPPHRLPGTAVVLGRLTQGVPLALMQNLKYNRVLHEHLLLVSVSFAEKPRVSAADRAVVTSVCAGVARVELHYGFMEQPNVPKGLSEAVSLGRIEPCRVESVIYFTGHETINALGRLPQMARWRESVYALMHRNAQRPGAYFKIPASHIMEVGVEFEI